MNICFTDRYGGNAPAWIRGCHGRCEAMGFHPTNNQAEWPSTARAAGVPEEDGTPDDGWRFIKCAECNGTGRVSWIRSIARIPRWIWRGLVFGRMAMRRDVNPPDYTIADRFKLWMYASFGADLMRLKKELL